MSRCMVKILLQGINIYQADDGHTKIDVAQNSYSGWERGARMPCRKEYRNIVSVLKK